VRRAARVTDDGYRNSLIPGLKSTGEAERLADELAFSSGRLAELDAAPPGLYAEVACAPDVEEAIWLAFLIAYVGVGEGEDPFAEIRAARVPWGAMPSLHGVRGGPRGSVDPGRAEETIAAYRAWAARAGSQADALSGDAQWSAQRRFARTLERLVLPGLRRDTRYEFLVSLARLGRVELRAGTLGLGAGRTDDEVTLAAKRVFGIGDPMLLERRAGELAGACELPIDVLDLALFNWAREGDRVTMAHGAPAPDGHAARRAPIAAALGLT
jgi:hypothetical protein